MKVRPVFHIHLRCAGVTPLPIGKDTLRLEPSGSSPSGVRALQRHRLLVRQLLDGLVVHAAIGDDGQPFPSLEGLSLRFQLMQVDPKAGTVLNFTPLFSLRQPTFRNQASAADLSLEEGSASPIGGRASPLAEVEIGGISSAWLQNPPHFGLNLQPRALQWVYYVITKQLDKTPEISDSVAARAMQFEVTPLTADSQATAQDRVAQALLAANAGARVYRLSSKQPPPLDGKDVLGLRLKLNDLTYFADLPPPANEQLMQLTVLNKPPQDAIYRVIQI